MVKQIIEPISTDLDSLAECLMAACKPTTPVPTSPYKKRQKAKQDKAVTIAKAMWNADRRPCSWHELDQDEKAEWIVMAKAAMMKMKDA